MILKEDKKYRDGDKPRKGKKFRRVHLLVKCDKCNKEKWMVKTSFIKSRTHHCNNQDKLDYCKYCWIERTTELGLFKRPNLNYDLTDSVSSKEEKPLYRRHSSGYLRRWTTDVFHPRLVKNGRDKKPKGGRVYEHILIMEEYLGRYLTKREMVHHINGNKTDNRIENLHLCRDNIHHQQIHKKMEQFMNQLLVNGVVSFDKEKEEFKLI